MMNLFRSLADAGKTVVCITHSLANVERTCHLVVVLTSGGKLAFIGKPSEALKYFGIERLGDVYDRLSEKPAEDWQAAFVASSAYRQYVTTRLTVTGAGEPEPVFVPPRKIREQLRLFARQTVLLSRRYLAILLGDRPALLMMLGQSLSVVALLIILFGDLSKIANPVEHAHRAANLLFLVAVSCLWFGCNNAAKEIVKERLVYARERDFNLQVSSYYASKLGLLAILSSLQATLLYTLVNICCKPPGTFFQQWVFVLALAVVGVTIGLFISAVSRTADVAVTLIPIALIPQIILTGVVAPLEGASKILAQGLVTSYWGYEGLMALLPEQVATFANIKQGSAVQALLVMLGHGVVFISLAIGFMALRDRREKRYSRAISKRGRKSEVGGQR